MRGGPPYIRLHESDRFAQNVRVYNEKYDDALQYAQVANKVDGDGRMGTKHFWCDGSQWNGWPGRASVGIVWRGDYGRWFARKYMIRPESTDPGRVELLAIALCFEHIVDMVISTQFWPWRRIAIMSDCKHAVEEVARGTQATDHIVPWAGPAIRHLQTTLGLDISVGWTPGGCNRAADQVATAARGTDIGWPQRVSNLFVQEVSFTGQILW